MKVSFGRHKILKCPLCLKHFSSKYAMDYHKENAKVLCPKYEDKEMEQG